MFFYSYADRARCMHPGFADRMFGRHWRREHSGREGRIFDSGDLRLVILALIAEKPRHGYEIIKALGERVGGDYSPSPGVVYPTLTYLEEIGHASVTADHGGRKLYEITAEGRAYLDANKAQVDAIFSRLDEAKAREGGSIGPVIRAMENLRMAVRMRVRRQGASPEQIRAIVDLLDETAKAVEKL